MNLFITGANGYIGRNFIKKIVKKKNCKIFAVTRKKKNKKIRNVKWLIGGIDRDWRELKKTDILIHFAAAGTYNKLTNFEETYNFNVYKSTQLILNALKFGCKKWIIISTNKEEKIVKLIKTKKIQTFKAKEPYFNYALTKYIFSNICKNFSSVFGAKCRIIKLFHVYGGDEKKTRLWPLLKNYSKQNKNLKMTSGNQVYDFNHIDDVVDGLVDCINFKKKGKIFPQEWDLASGRSMSVKSFAIKIWKKNNAKSKIFFSKIKNFDRLSYLVNKKKLWKINFRKP